MKNIMFDVDGTIFDTGEGVSASILYALEKMGEKPLPAETLRKFIGPPLIDGFMQFAGFSEEKANTAIAYYREFYTPKGVYMAKLYDGIESLFSDLYNAGKNLFVISSKPTVFVQKLFAKYNIDKYFKDIAEVRFDNCEISKADLIESAMKKYGLDISDTVMIGDRKFDIDGAKEIGVRSIGVTYGFGSRDELLRHGADFIADSAEEIKKYI